MMIQNGLICVWPFDSIDEFESWMKKASKGNDRVFYSIIDLKDRKGNRYMCLPQDSTNSWSNRTGEYSFFTIVEKNNNGN